MDNNEGNVLAMGFVAGFFVAAVLIVFVFTYFHSGFCLTHYITIDGKHYYWGHDPNEQSGRSYYWRSVRVMPETTFILLPKEED